MVVPAVVIAAPASGSGKTTVATGLMGALRRAGHRVGSAKVGPDFIDPGYHELATGRPGRNLDPVLVGDELIGPLYRHGSVGTDITVIEGVMGLFDGRITEQTLNPAPGSTAHVAGLLGAPVILVVDARGQGQSIAALLHGFSTFGQAVASGATGIAPVRIAGVILNRVGTSRHEEVLRQACEHAGMPVFGAIPRAGELEVPSRHLGLVTAIEHGRLAHQAVEAMTELVARHVDLDAVVGAAGIGAVGQPWQPDIAPVDTKVTVALAAGKAFSFGYSEHTELLQMAGADVVAFDPLTEGLPDSAQALVIPGGFPEQFTAELSANAQVRQQIATLAAGGAPVHAECAGLTYLVDDLDGHPMCGVLAGSAAFTPRLTLGYRDAVAVADSSMYVAGQRVVGHEFHRTAVEFSDACEPAWAFRGAGGATVRDGAVRAGVHAAYLHTHPAAHPHSVRRFVSAATKLAE